MTSEYSHLPITSSSEHGDIYNIIQLDINPPNLQRKSSEDNELAPMIHQEIENNQTDVFEIETNRTDNDSEYKELKSFSFTRFVHKIKSELYFLIYPDRLPVTLQLWHSQNITLPISYLLVGTFQGLSTGIITVYLLHIGATESQQTTIKALRSLPASFKVLFGFISDYLPIIGYRRKPYILIGWSISSFAMLLMYRMERIRIIDSSITNQMTTIDIPQIALLYFLFGFGFWFADVIADSIMTEKAKFENTIDRGRLQSTCYACRFFAQMIALIIVTYGYMFVSASGVFLTLGLLPWFTVVPSVYYLKEDKYTPSTTWKQRMSEVWNTLCSPAVWQPLSFIFIFTTLQVSNAAWYQYQYTVLKFSSVEINTFFVANYILLYVGVMIYKQYLREYNYRFVYIGCVSVSSLFSLLQILLILQINQLLHIPNFVFALGDEAFSEFAYGIQYLPTIIMMSHLCPVGSEGTTFAMFTSINNTAIALSSAISTYLLNIWDVSENALKSNNLTGLLYLTILTSCLQGSGLLFIRLLPKGVEDLKKLDEGEKSKIGGTVLVTVIILAITMAIVTSILNVVSPGWMGS